MTKELIFKELNLIVSSKIFWITFSTIIVLSSLTTYVLVENYNYRNKEHINYLLENERLLKTGSFDQFVYYQPVKPPSKLNVLFNGVKQFIGAPILEKNPVPLIFHETDFFFVIGFLFSFLAIILSFRSVSGEIEDGTFKLILSNNVKRNSILIGKWISGICILLFSLILCFIISTIMILLVAELQWSINETIAIVMILLISIIYLSIFYLIGMYISIKSKSSKFSMIVCGYFWCVFVLVLPGVPDYIGKIISPTPTPASLVYHTELKPKYERAKLREDITVNLRNEGLANFEIDSIINNYLNEINEELEKEKQKYIKYFDSKIQGQMLSAVAFSIISPYSSFIIAGNEIAGTGISSQVHFQQESQKFSQRYSEFINSKKNDHVGNIPKLEYNEIPIKFRILAASIPMISLLVFHIIILVKVFRAFGKIICI